jgi:murein DD-endopeptidase MepM/ murein hydrolase activator NlpD
MGRHRPSPASSTVADLLARLAAETDVPEPPAADIEIVVAELDTHNLPAVTTLLPLPGRRLPPVPPRVRWAAGLTVAGMVASGLIATDADAQADTPEPVAAVSPPPLFTPVTGLDIGTRLGELAASRAERESATQSAQDDRAAAEEAAAEAAAEAAREAEERRAAQAAQEAAAKAAKARAAVRASQAAEQATETSSAASTPRGSGTVGAIVPGARLTSGFGSRWGTLHAGIDLAAPIGTPIYSPVAGRVVRAGAASGFGNAIYIQDADGDVWVFGHMREMDVYEGQTVSVGERIAWVGNEGQSTGPHVHIERHIGGINGKKVDPSGALGL